jgi:hypothetical protein
MSHIPSGTLVPSHSGSLESGVHPMAEASTRQISGPDGALVRRLVLLRPSAQSPTALMCSYVFYLITPGFHDGWREWPAAETPADNSSRDVAAGLLSGRSGLIEQTAHTYICM